jgi:hypothetical protein
MSAPLNVPGNLNGEQNVRGALKGRRLLIKGWKMEWNVFLFLSSFFYVGTFLLTSTDIHSYSGLSCRNG